MSRKGLLGVVAAVFAVVLAAWVWSAEAQAPATPPAAGAPGQPAEQPKAEPAPAAEAPAAPPAGEAAPAAPEKVKGWTITVKWGEGAPAMRDLTFKLAGNKMLVEGFGGGKGSTLLDADAKATYSIISRGAPGSPGGGPAMRRVMVEKFAWSDMDRRWHAVVDDAIMTQRMRQRQLAPKEREAAEALAKSLEEMKKPATLEATEETQKFGDYECVKYNVAKGEKCKGIAWVAKDLKIEAPFWNMVGHILAESLGGLPILARLDGLDTGFAVRVNLEYAANQAGRLTDRKLNFWIDKITEGEFNAKDFEIPSNAEVSEPMKGI
jgi:hypothetical protein